MPFSLSSRVLKFTILGFALMASACDKQSEQKAQPQPKIETEPAGKIDRSQRTREIPDMTVEDAEGNELSLRSLKGKPVLINLWATWCAPCVAELPSLDKLAADRKGKLQVVTISQDSAEPDKIASFLAQNGIANLKSWQDQKSDLSFKYGAQSLPMTIFYDAEGLEVWRVAGPRDWADKETAALFEEKAAGLKPLP